jgi:hypothetical protein
MGDGIIEMMLKGLSGSLFEFKRFVSIGRGSF